MKPDSTQQPIMMRRWLVAGLVVLLALVIFGLLMPARGRTALPSAIQTSSGNLLILAIPTYLAGVLSLLSPCCLPILPAYFAWTFGAQRGRLFLMSLAFFLGLATTMVILGAGLTMIGSLAIAYRDTITTVGGLLIVVFGLMSIAGLGFSGLQFAERPAATLAGTYLYGLTFAFGWSVCIGPILGAVFTALMTTGLSVFGGAALAFIYALGIATPLTLLAYGFQRLGGQGGIFRLLRGRGFSLQVAGRTINLHTTSLISGSLLILLGVLLATGKLNTLSERLATADGTALILQVENWLARLVYGF